MMDVSGLDWNSAVRFILQAVQEVSETKLAGEDLTNDVLKIEGQFSSTYISTATTTVVKTGAGLLHAIVVTGTTDCTIIVIKTEASGTILGSWSDRSGNVPLRRSVHDGAHDHHRWREQAHRRLPVGGPMPVKFDSLDGNARTAVFSVPDGVGGQQLVTREVADGITNDSLDKHLIALAGGPAAEFPDEVAPVKPPLAPPANGAKGDTADDDREAVGGRWKE